MGETLFKHHPDGWIYLYKDGEELTCSLAEFLTQEPDYALPARDDIVMQAYVPGVRHVYNSRESQYPGKMPWAEGDRYLSRIVEYRAAIESARTAAAAQAQVEASAAAQAALDALPESEKAKRQLAESDAGLIRFAEDVWNVLKTKGVVVDADLPNDEIREKLKVRADLRVKVGLEVKF